MKEKIKEIIGKTFEINNVADNISQQNCHKWDSLNHLKLMYELETAFDLSFEPDEIVKMKSLDEIEHIVSEKAINK